jgi:hypothetical protein
MDFRQVHCTVQLELDILVFGKYDQKLNTLVFIPYGVYSKEDKKGKEQESGLKLEYTED